MQLYEKYGYTSTVISSPHQTCLKSYSFLEELLKCQHPKVLIIETDMFYEGAPEFNSKKIKKDNTSVIKRKISAFLENFSEKRFEDMMTVKRIPRIRFPVITVIILMTVLNLHRRMTI